MPSAAPPCPHRPPCPGCPSYGVPGIAHAARERLEALAAETGVALRVVEADALGSRLRARLAVRGRASAPKLGLFQAGTHRIVDIPRCGIHCAEVNDVAAAVREAIRAADVEPYADRPHRGALRYVQIFVQRQTRAAQVVLVENAPERSAKLSALIERLQANLGAMLHSLWWNGQPERSNAILGPHWEHGSGPEQLEQRIGTATAFFPPGAFAQNYLAGADAIAQRITSWIPEGARVAELYAGTGAWGLNALSRAAHVAFNELDAQGLDGLRAGIAAADAEARCSIHAGRAGERSALLDAADVVIVDPPRKGLDAELLTALCERPPQRLIYVSCGLDSFLRECEQLRAAGVRLVELEAHALFPFTEHVETLARFDR